MADANIKAVITADDRASKVIKEFGTQTEKTSDKIEKSWLGTKAATLVTTAAIAAGLKTSLGAFEQQELATARLEAGIKNVKSATDNNVDSLLKQATALQKTTRFSDEAVISAQGILSTFQLNQQAIEKLTPRLLDMSEGLARVDGTMPDLEGNAILVAKALGGEDVTGLTGALRRVGVVMTQHQTDLLNTGNMQQRLSIITEVLDQNFNGLAESAGNTTAGKLAILKNQFNELQEKIGQTISTALLPFINAMNQHPVILQTVTIALLGLAAAFVAVKTAAAISAVIGGARVAIAALGGTVTAVTGGISTMSAVMAGASFGGIAILAGAAAAAAGAIYLVYRAVQDTIGAIRAWDSASRSASSAGDSLSASIQKIKASNLSPEEKARLIRGISGFAEGGSVTGNTPIIVGEKGPELFVPKSNGEIIPNDKLSNGVPAGNSINITIQAGAFMGNQADARKYAQLIMDAYKDLASMKNMSPAQMLGT